MVLVSSADHVQHVKERAQDDMGEQFAAKQLMECHENVAQGVTDRQTRMSNSPQQHRRVPG